MSIFLRWLKMLGSATGGVIAFSVNSAIAQVIQDSTLPINSQVTIQENIINIEGGTKAGGNLFHSFEQFSVPDGSTAYFKNSGVQNIISRVTGKSISNIEGILKADGTANLFLINPNGIVFGRNASLQIGGSFVASTASSLNFADGTKFSTTNTQNTALLTVSVPIGLQFKATAAPIRNQSRASNPDGNTKNIFWQPVGLQVVSGKTLALVGGDIVLEGGNLTAASGRIELGSVAGNSLVSLNPTNQGWSLGYEGVQNFQNIQMLQRTDNNTKISSQVDTSGTSGGNIQIQGKIVELSGNFTRLISQTTGAGNGRDLNITTQKLIIRDGAQVGTSTRGEGAAGNLTVNASESLELIGTATTPFISRSTLFSTTGAAGKAGDIVINTRRLRIQDGAEISAESSGVLDNNSRKLIPATGKGGNLTVNAFDSVELIGTSGIDLPSGLLASTLGSGDAGQVTISTGKLIVRDGAAITVSSQPSQRYVYLGGVPALGKAGELNVNANFILLDNGKLTSNGQSGQGGNIALQVQDLLSMRRNSKISTNSGNLGTYGNGGNITIDAPDGLVFAAPLENSDITANAFLGSGGKITINADSIFGFVQRDRAELVRLLQTEDPDKLDPKYLQTNDITAFSQQNPSLSGVVEINSPDVDPSKGLVELPVNAVDAQDKIVAGCNSAQRIARASFITTGRGGIASSPKDALISDAVLTDWIALEGQDENPATSVHNRPVNQKQGNTQKADSVNNATQIVEAQGWVMDSNGNVVLVAQAPTATPHSSALNPASCPVN
ncbi:filamentous hemagglutinin N-terminal domain-containing protein [Nostoc sp. CENA67]|uniref:Filamentous hemagglutinin N-terminal domain-containing protein n=1 Tax=Amazonocrinis nigriterrae CENA67 TaxID=2794033 RepID=A0A8J7HQZ5_9NOST|nr:filamentous hemagglutinin N-terminal domain-containing protein [Amazonocrinis nigriterrae]MBH8564057.1 filamentous hemagglutinin N-terminal domain-containing protein [Amazonocrinis nigriterrae CENA67]